MNERLKNLIVHTCIICKWDDVNSSFPKCGLALRLRRQPPKNIYFSDVDIFSNGRWKFFDAAIPLKYSECEKTAKAFPIRVCWVAEPCAVLIHVPCERETLSNSWLKSGWKNDLLYVIICGFIYGCINSDFSIKYRAKWWIFWGESGGKCRWITILTYKHFNKIFH